MSISLDKNRFSFKVISILLISLLILPIVMSATNDIVEASVLENMSRRSRIPIYIKNRLVGWFIENSIELLVASLTPQGQAALLAFAIVAGAGVIAYCMYDPNTVDYARYDNQCILTYSGHYMCTTSI